MMRFATNLVKRSRYLRPSLPCTLESVCYVSTTQRLNTNGNGNSNNGNNGSNGTKSNNGNTFHPAKRLDIDYNAPGANVWNFVTEYMNKYKTVNHGQGYPNWDTPPFVKEAAINAINNDHNQYCPNTGHPKLVNKLIDIYSSKLNEELTPKNIQTTIGACAGIENCCQAILDEDDEVLTFEPFFDFYKTQVNHCGAKLNTVPLKIDHKTKQWKIDLDSFEYALSTNSSIKAVILNTPQNPTGCVTDSKTMTKMVSILKQHPDVIVITDEVYEDILFDDNKHLSIASYPGMFNRTLTVNSAAKKFSCTGWKTGWVIGSEEMIEAVNYVTRGQNWCQPTPLQVAVGTMLDDADKHYKGHDNYWLYLRQMYQKKRDKIIDVLECGGLKPTIPQGSFFCVADCSDLMNLLVNKGEIEDDSNFDPNNSLTWMDWKLSAYLAMNAGITCLPMSAFLSDNFENRYKYLRFAFCVTDDAFDRSLQGMDDMVKRLQGINTGNNNPKIVEMSKNS